MRKNIYFLLICLLGVIVIVSCFFFTWPANDGSFMPIYLISKIILGLLFIGSFIYCYTKKTANGITGSLVGVSVVFQFIPLAIRGIYVASNEPLIWSIIVLCLSLIIYLALFGGIISMGKKMLESDEKYRCNEIPVKRTEK